jgi:predicted N-acetyltransferase YhbS
MRIVSQSRRKPEEAKMTLAVNFEPRAAFLYAGRHAARPVTIGPESPADFCARERLLDQAFGAARFDKTVERLRAGRKPAEGLAYAAKDSCGLIGTLRLWHIRAGGVPALLLGPLAVAGACQSQGIGRRLMEKALRKAADSGHMAILLVGDPSYYEPFGFSRGHTLSLSLPGPVDPQRFLGIELKEGALKSASGIVTASGARDSGANTNIRLSRAA